MEGQAGCAVTGRRRRDQTSFYVCMYTNDNNENMYDREELNVYMF